MDYLYRGGASPELHLESLNSQLQLVDAAKRFGVSALVRDCRMLIRDQLSHSNCLQVYKFAMVSLLLI
jgi:hypothetical protein